MAHEDIGGTRTIGVRVQGEPERIANYLQDPMNADPYDRALVQAIIRQYAANPTATT